MNEKLKALVAAAQALDDSAGHQNLDTGRIPVYLHGDVWDAFLRASRSAQDVRDPDDARSWIASTEPHLVAAVVTTPVAMWMDKRRQTCWNQLRHLQSGRLLARIQLVSAWRTSSPGDPLWTGAEYVGSAELTHVPVAKFAAERRVKNFKPTGFDRIDYFDTITEATAAVEAAFTPQFHILRWQIDGSAGHEE